MPSQLRYRSRKRGVGERGFNEIGQREDSEDEKKVQMKKSNL